MTARRTTVLIVEDDLALRQMYRAALAFAGFDIREVGNGLDALRQIDGDPPDAVILDLGLPLMDRDHGVTGRRVGADRTVAEFLPVL